MPGMTLIIADSRGRGLQTHIDQLGTKEPGTIHVACHPGAGLELAVLKSLRIIRETKPTLIIVLAGICDLTWKNINTKTIGVRYQKVGENVTQYMKAVRAAYDLLRSDSATAVSFATLTGVDLTDCNNPHRKNMNNEQYKQYAESSKITHRNQTVINDAILEINLQIVRFNRGNNIRTVWIAGLVHAYIKKSYHHYYRRLSDGCHPDHKTKKAWAVQLVKSITRIQLN